MRLFGFEGIDERLELMPLAARRALDRTGYKLALSVWQKLTPAARRSLVEAGSSSVVDESAVLDVLRMVTPPPERLAPLPETPTESVPEQILLALGSEHPLSPDVWAGLSPLDRYALAKTAGSRDARRLLGAYQELVAAARGGAVMVDVSHKPPSLRRAIAESRVSMTREALTRLLRAEVPKGDVLATARLAGIMAAKRTSEIIPLCHPIALTHVSVELRVEESASAVTVGATVEALDRTGVEMEALVAVSTAALTIYDMMKSLDRSMIIGPTRLVFKSGGRSGQYPPEGSSA